ncbi:acyl carrier protein [Pelotomaculum thermopropionicum SI]|uniref:Acyl carrier protein n=1 Tax=Pelotomaculum thermopropionicum (strain DSM 13744 / JCM 10971 / SI) TaxID=370438 RepID=A5D1H9_PELTS|nr:acyl carrier protein [Pelotomaculum thermopropionicum SI]
MQTMSVFDRVKSIIVEQLGVEEDEVKWSHHL